MTSGPPLVPLDAGEKRSKESRRSHTQADADGNQHSGQGPVPEAWPGTEEVSEGPPVKYQSVKKLVPVTIGLCLAVFCVSMDQTILATAIPRITSQFNSLNDVAWYGSAYILAAAAVQLIFGKLYTMYSTKWVFMAGIVIFEVGSLVCALAPSSVILIVGRAIAGLGAAGIFSGGIIITATNVPLRHRPIYTSLLGSMHSVASVAGPLLGGALTDHASWRWCFYINLPFGGITVLFLISVLPSNSPLQEHTTWQEQVKNFDLIGSFFLVPGIISLLLALEWGGSKYPWDNARIIGLFVVFGVLMPVFVAVQFWQKDRATIPIRLLKNRSVWGALWYSVCLSAVLLVSTYYLPMWFQAVKGVSATNSGIMNLPSIVGIVVFSIIGGGVVTAVGYYTPFIIASSAITAIAAGMLTTLKVSSGIGEWFGYQLLLSFGVGLGVQNVLLVAQVAVPKVDMAMATSLLSFSQMLSGAIFLAVGQSVFQNQLVQNVREQAPAVDPTFIIQIGAGLLRENLSKDVMPGVLRAYNAAITQTFYVGVAMAALAIVGSVFIEWISLKEQQEGEKE